jgi:2-dehydropantoate 2-reductase
MDILVFGAGSLGSLLGGLLARAHEVTLVGRDPHMQAVDAEGLRITGEEPTTVHPRAKTAPPATADLAIVTVKSYDTAAAARALADCVLDACLSLQNGMGNEATLAAALDCPVLAGTCTYGARRTAPGAVECTGIGQVTLGPFRASDGTATAAVRDAFRAADIETTVADAIETHLWSKLAVNCGINALTALARVENGALLDGPAAGTAREAARETAAIARTQGIDLPAVAATDALTTVASETAANHSSMYQDMASSSRTEIDAINGYVVETAAQAVPVNETVSGLVQAWEDARGLR